LFVNISLNWVKISLHTEFQLHRLPRSTTASFRLNPIQGGGVAWVGDPNYFLDYSSSWVEMCFNAEYQLPSIPGTGSSMVGDKQQNSVELEASLSPAEAEVWAVAKADQ
jgi:hypothetical protein